MAREDFSFKHGFRVRYSEVDPQMVVFNARILDYTDIVLGEFWRERGVPFVGADAIECHVVKATAEYLKPMRFDEVIEGHMRVLRFGRSSMTILAEFYGENSDELRGKVELVQVHVDLASGRPLAIPDDVRDRLADANSER
jgi:acyl-CoA thioester hydrolase